MDKIVSLARRRGFVFPSSEIYGGLGSAYDYGHYGVLLKENVKARWLEAMVRERDDIVALDSSIILHPAVWEASGPRRRLLRSARRLPLLQAPLSAPTSWTSAQCGQQAEQASGRDRAVRPHRAAPVQPHVPNAHRPGRGDGPGRVPAPGDRAGDLHQLQERRADRAAQAAVRHRADRQGVPQRDHARQLHLPRRSSSSRWRWSTSSRPRRRDEWFRYWVEQRVAWHLRYGIRREPPARAPARRRGALPLLVGDERHRVPLSRSAGRSSRGSRTAATSTSPRTRRRRGRSSSGSTARSATRRMSSSPRSA